MSTGKVHLRHYLLYKLQKKNSIMIASENLCSAFVKDAVTEHTNKRWFAIFPSGYISMDEGQLAEWHPCECRIDLLLV